MKFDERWASSAGASGTRELATDAQSWKLVGYLGTGGYGPVIWNNFFVSWERLHPQTTSTEWYEDTEYTLYIHDFTDERTVLLLGEQISSEEAWED